MKSLNTLNKTECKKLLAKHKINTIEDVDKFQEKFLKLHDDYVQINKCYGKAKTAQSKTCKEVLKKHMITSAKKYESFIKKYEKMMHDADIALECFIKIKLM